jgi:hypothetical protein
MKKLTCDDFEVMTIVELVEFIEKEKYKIVEYKDEMLLYFKRRRVESLVPYYFFDLYTDIKDKYDLRREYYISINVVDQAVNNLPKDFLDTHHSPIIKIKDIYFEFYLFKGIILFLEDMYKGNYFESGKAQMLLERLINDAHGYRFKYNDDVISALAVFMKDKEESIQMMIIEIIVEYIDRCEWIVNILLYLYKNGINYTKRGVMHAFVKYSDIIVSGTDDFHTAKEVLDVVAEDMEGEDKSLRNQIIAFIEIFSYIPEEISQYLLEEKGIIYTEEMKYEAFYEKVMGIEEILKEKIEGTQEKEKNTKH